jgi:hypothetical protein
MPHIPRGCQDQSFQDLKLIASLWAIHWGESRVVHDGGEFVFLPGELLSN